MPNMKKGDDVMDIQPAIVDAMKAKGWRVIEPDRPTEPQPSKGDKPKGNKNNG